METTEAVSKQIHSKNGVNLNALRDTIRAIESNRDLAAFQFRAENQWLECGHNRSTIQSFYGVCEEDRTRTKAFVMDADEPAVLLGQDKGANPVEYVLHALSACLTTSMVYHAAARGIEIKSLRSSSKGDLDLRGFLGISDAVKKGYQRVTLRFQVVTTKPTTEEMLMSCALYSPVYDMISAGLPVDIKIEVSQ